jgi:hypothetical protein
MFPIELQTLHTLSAADSSGPIFVPVMLVDAPCPILKQNPFVIRLRTTNCRPLVRILPIDLTVYNRLCHKIGCRTSIEFAKQCNIQYNNGEKYLGEGSKDKDQLQ